MTKKEKETIRSRKCAIERDEENTNSVFVSLNLTSGEYYNLARVLREALHSNHISDDIANYLDNALSRAKIIF